MSDIPKGHDCNFYDLTHHIFENYVNDLVIKSKKDEDHLSHLETIFKRCGRFTMRMNPLKYVYRVTIGKCLGFFVHRHGIKADDVKIKAI